MIVFDLQCEDGHRFEGWFGSSRDYEDQRVRGLVACPQCGATQVNKAPMAPSVPAKGNTRADRSPQPPSQSASEPPFQSPFQAPSQRPSQERSQVLAPQTGPEGGKPAVSREMPAEVREAIAKLAEAQGKALKNSTWVGSDFAKQSREMHYGDRDEAPIHGQTSLAEARALVEEGVPIAPLPFPVAPPEKLN